MITRRNPSIPSRSSNKEGKRKEMIDLNLSIATK